MNRPSISAVFITYNEEHRLARALASVTWVDEIIVLDSGSTDRTEEIARRYTDGFHTHPWDGFGPQRQRAIEMATSDWVLVVDADEEVTPELRRAIEHAVRAPGDNVGFAVEWRTCYLGECFGRGWHREWRRRLFRRGTVRYHDHVIHEHMSLDGPVGRLPGALLHYPYRDLEHHVAKINRYSSTIARERYARGTRGGVAASVLRGFGYFSRAYLLRGGFLYGRVGFVDAAMHGFYGFLKYAKLWELGRARADPRAPERPAERASRATR